MVMSDDYTVLDPEIWGHQILDEIYDLRIPAEQSVLEQLRPDERDIFRLYAIGIKFDHQQRFEKIPPQDVIIEAWRNSDRIDRQPAIVLAQQHPDPRLNAANFQINAGILHNFCTRLPEAAQPAFVALVCGCKAGDSNYRQPHMHPTIIDIWLDKDVALRDQRIADGRRQYARFRTRPLLHEGNLASVGHFYVEPDPDAQMGDVMYVNLEPGPRGPDEPERPAGSRWVFERTIYQNMHQEVIAGGAWTHRIVHLFTLVSEDRRILKRMVVKIVGGTTIVHVQLDIENEFKHQRALSFRDCASMLDTYGYSIRERLQVPHLGYIYMDYAAFGDLRSLIDRLKKEPNKQLPEPYLWLIFRGLAEALLLMETGMAIDRNAPEQEDQPIYYPRNWQPIVNPDIKTLNVILSEAQNDFYPAYKTAKMIDFGLCFSDPNKKGRGGGTPGLCAPEQMYRQLPHYAHVPVNVSSEIFNVGLIMLSLMEGKTMRLTDEVLADGGFGHLFDYDKCYSAALEELVARSLELDPQRRPDLNMLLYRTRVGLERWEKVYGSAGRPDTELPDFATYRLESKEEFRIGEEAPDNWLGMKARKTRTAEEAGIAPAGPAEKKQRAERSPPPPPPPPGQVRVNNDPVPLPGMSRSLGASNRHLRKDLRLEAQHERQPVGLPGIHDDEIEGSLPLPRGPGLPAKGFLTGLIDELAPANGVSYGPGLGQPNLPPMPHNVPPNMNFPNAPLRAPNGPPPGFTFAKRPQFERKDLIQKQKARKVHIPRPVNLPRTRAVPDPVSQPSTPPEDKIGPATQPKRESWMRGLLNRNMGKVNWDGVLISGEVGKRDGVTDAQKQPQALTDSAKENNEPGSRRSSPIDVTDDSSGLSSPPPSSLSHTPSLD
ncbi:Nn.00g040110.m01.CDS01 [Neocucurbitaria sp. VM-36]